MLKKILILSLVPLVSFAAKNTDWKEIVVKKTERISYDGSSGLEVTGIYKGKNRRFFLPKEENDNEKIFAIFEKAERKNRRLKLKVTRVENDLVMYRSIGINEVLSVGGDCKKMISKTKSPRISCSKGYAVNAAKLMALRKKK